MPKLGEHKRSFGVTASIMTHLCFDTILAATGGSSMDIHNKIAELTDQFELETKDVDWSEVEFTLEDKIVEFVHGGLMAAGFSVHITERSSLEDVIARAFCDTVTVGRAGVSYDSGIDELTDLNFGV